MSRRRRPTLTRREAERMAHLSWDAFAALQRTEAREPELRDNPYWQPLKDAAHARFRAVFESEAMK